MAGRGGTSIRRGNKLLSMPTFHMPHAHMSRVHQPNHSRTIFHQSIYRNFEKLLLKNLRNKPTRTFWIARFHMLHMQLRISAPPYIMICSRRPPPRTHNTCPTLIAAPTTHTCTGLQQLFLQVRSVSGCGVRVVRGLVCVSLVTQHVASCVSLLLSSMIKAAPVIYSSSSSSSRNNIIR